MSIAMRMVVACALLPALPAPGQPSGPNGRHEAESTQPAPSGSAVSSAPTERPLVSRSTNYDIAPDYVWGFVTGFKQPLGAFQGGLSVHQITQSEYGTMPPPDEGPFSGNPDHIFWVDEDSGTFGISSGPTGRTDGAYVNPGGMLAFAPNGTLWYTLGGRAEELPLDLYRSDVPYGLDAFTVVLDDYETLAGSTCPNVNVHDSNVMLFWRRVHSARTDAKVMLGRCDTDTGLGVIQHTAELGTGNIDDNLGPVGIEQVWSRFDPRFNYTFVTWTFYDLRDGGNPPNFGAHPFMYSDDDGDTWRMANGQPFTDLPLSYSQIDDIIVPYDHLALRDWTNAQLFSDMGVSPNGTFWTAIRRGDFNFENSSSLRFFRFAGTHWESEELTGTMHSVSKTHAVGVTKDYLVLLYAEYYPDYVLKVRLSADDGATWTAPVAIRALDPSNIISWISFVQPADTYADNSARFFYTFFDRSERWYWGNRWRNAVSWIKVDVGGTRGDCDGDDDITLNDVESIINCMTGPFETTLESQCQCADLNADGHVDLLDWSAMERALQPTDAP